MATIASPKPSPQGTATAPTQTQVEGNPGTPGNHQAELDAFLAAGLGAPDLSGTADRGPADVAEPVQAQPERTKAKATTPEPSPDFDNQPETDQLANPDELSRLIEGDEDADGDDAESDDDESDTDETEAHAEESDADEEEHQPGDGNKLPKGIQKRLSKLTERSKQYKAEAESAKAEAARLKAENEALAANRVIAAPTPDDPFADVVDASTLDSRLAAARAALEWCDENVEGGVIVDAKGNETEFSMKEVAQRRRFLERLVNEHAPKRREWLERRKEATEVARQVYPSLYREGSKMATVRGALLRQIPGLANNPDADIFVGDAVIGAMVRTGQLKAFKAPAKDAAPATAAAAKPAPAPRTPPRAAPAPAPSATTSLKPAHAAVLARAESGDSEAMRQAIELGLL